MCYQFQTEKYTIISAGAKPCGCGESDPRKLLLIIARVFCEGDFGAESFLTAEVAEEYIKVYQTKKDISKVLNKFLEVIWS